MRARKNRKTVRLPAIVPRFIKSAVAIGAIPTLVGCDKGTPKRVQPVVATYVDHNPPVVAAYAPDAPLAAPDLPAVVAAMVGDPQPPRPIDAGVDAPKPKKKPKAVVGPGPTVVAAFVGRDDLNDLVGPPVVAAMLPPPPPPPPPKKTKKP